MGFVHASNLSLITGLLVFISVTVPSAQAEMLAPKEKLAVVPSLSISDDEATNVSGAACFDEEDRHKSCLLIGDEVKYARFFSVDGSTLTPSDKLFLLPELDSNGKKVKETDAEGVAFENGVFYFVGSHGRNKEGEKQWSRYFVYRVPVDRETGRPKDMGTAAKESSSVERSGVLERFFETDPTLKSFAELAPEEHGVNIEGVAVSGDNLFFGLRGPVVSDNAFVVRARVKAVFGGETPAYESYRLGLGTGQGIRDLARVNDGLLILSGPEDRKPGKAKVFFWRPGGNPILLADLGTPKADEGQPEVLLVLKETQQVFSVLIMSDGPENGRPALYEIPVRP